MRKLHFRISSESLLDFGCETLVSSKDFQNRLTRKEGEARSDAEAHEKLEVQLRDAKLKLSMMEGWKKSVTDADQKAATPLLKVAEAKSELISLLRNETSSRRG